MKGELHDHLAQHGWARFDPALDSHFLDKLTQIIGVEAGRGGRRDLLDQQIIKHLIQFPVISQMMNELLGSTWRCIRGLFFDKSPEANWFVPWHRDLVVAVQERHDVRGYGPWSVKDSVVHVQPPRYILENMLAVRLHLDDCGPDNGPLRVIPGSHLSTEEATEPVVELMAKRGELLLMRPLLLHSSSRAMAPNHRRVIHLEYASVDLPRPLEWRWGINATESL